MINNKNQLKKALKENKNKIIIKRLYNFDDNNKIKVGDTATIEKVQSNAFTIKYDAYDKEAWIYYDNIEVKDNKIIYYNYIDDFDEKRTAEKVEQLKKENVDIIPVETTDKINQNRYSNFKYVYKYIYIINKIVEV